MGAQQAIVVGGGLAGFSAAHTVLENGGKCLLLDKSPFCGGNSTKATSGINGSETKTQKAKDIKDLLHLPTTNGEACGANSVDLEWVQVHPTGLVKPDDPDAKVKF